MDQSRVVTIDLKNGTYFVSYVYRNKGQRYHAAQFDAKYITYEQVRQWVEKKQGLMIDLP